MASYHYHDYIIPLPLRLHNISCHYHSHGIWHHIFTIAVLYHYFCQKCPSWDLKKRPLQCRYKKSETTFIIQTFPKNEDYSLWFHLLSLFRVGLDDFHFRALLALISEGKSDQNEKCNFAKEGVLKSKKMKKTNPS